MFTVCVFYMLGHYFHYSVSEIASRAKAMAPLGHKSTMGKTLVASHLARPSTSVHFWIQMDMLTMDMLSVQ